MNISKRNTELLMILTIFLLLPSTVTAVEDVRVVSDTSTTLVRNTTETILNRELNTKINDIVKELKFKEFNLDPAAWAASQQAIQQMSATVIKSVATGRNGNASYVEDYEEYFREIDQKAVSEFLFGPALSNVPDKVRFEIQNALSQEWVKEDRGVYQSVEVGSNESALDTVRKNFTICERDPLCVAHRAKADLEEEREKTAEEESQALRDHGGFIPQRVCKKVDDVNDTETEKCIIVSPPGAARTSSDFVFGKLPFEDKLQGEEFGEVVSGFISNLTNQAINSPTGVLGLSNRPDFSARIFGDDGSLSYVDALLADSVTDYQTQFSNPVDEPQAAEEEYVRLQEEVLDSIKELEEAIAEGEREAGGCFDLDLSSKLKKIKQASENNITISISTLDVLGALASQFDKATDGNMFTSIYSTFNTYQNQELFRTSIDNKEFEISFLNIEFKILVEEFKVKIDREFIRCNLAPYFGEFV